jgi:hypothetical protein
VSVSAIHETSHWTVPNMAHSAGPLISLAVSSTTKKSYTSFSSAALSLAAEFNCELARSKSDADKAKICRTYRDTIMRISMWADDIAAAFSDAFAPFLQKPQRGHDNEAWKSFASLAQRSQQTRTHDAQRIRHQTAIVAIWGAEIFEHYGWHELSLDNTRLLRSVACKQRHWTLAVKLINSVMLERHETRVVKHDNRLPLIGEHPHGSKIQDCQSPVQRRDIIAVIQRLQDSNDEVDCEEQRESRVETITGTPIRDYGLETDKHGMIVPCEGPRIVRNTSSPTHRPSKRRRLDHTAVENPRGSRNVSAAVTSPQLSSTSSSTPPSELTQFEEEDCDYSISAGPGRHSRASPVNGELTSDTSPVEHMTSDVLSTDDVSNDPSREILHGASFHTRHRPMSSLRRASTDRGVRVPGDTGSDTDFAADQSTRMTERCVENDEEDDEGFHADSRSTRSESAEASHEQNCLDSSSEMVEVDRQGPLGGAEVPEKCLPSPFCERELSLSATTRDMPEALSAYGGRCASNVCEERQPATHLYNGDTDQQKHEGSKEDCQVEGGSETVFCNTGDIATLEEATRISDPNRSLLLETLSEQPQGLTHPSSHQIKDGMTPNLEASSIPTPFVRFIPSLRETSIQQYCTDTNENDDGTIASRMASCYSSQLQNLLDLARKYSKDSETEEHNKLKVAWLERTRWANVYGIPEDFDPTSSLPLDADVWYMEWRTFQDRACTGEIFTKPIVIKQKFQDSDMHGPHGYMLTLKERFPDQQLDVQNSDTGECLKMDVKDFCATRYDAEKVDAKLLAATSNVINLRKIANADASLLTHMSRFRLLETLVDRAANLGPGKRISSQVNDISDCLGFDLLGFEGAFTRPHVDALMGTWVRCLSGAKAWMFAPSMNDKDWNDFARDGSRWSPADKGRVIILEQDDVLLMPPGLRVLHTVFTLGPSLMEGGMLWDECNVPALLDELIWVARNQSCTNEAIAYQLPRIIDTLEIWIEEHGERLSALRESPGYIQAVKRGIGALRDLGCKCAHGCTKNPDCPCSVQMRRCTAWCAKHPSLPSQAKGRTHHCMNET